MILLFTVPVLIRDRYIVTTTAPGFVLERECGCCVQLVSCMISVLGARVQGGGRVVAGTCR